MLSMERKAYFIGGPLHGKTLNVTHNTHSYIHAELKVYTMNHHALYHGPVSLTKEVRFLYNETTVLSGIFIYMF